jgi:CheY-like chemotaxis protein
VLETLRLLLLRQGHSVSVAEDGDTGLQRIGEIAPDVAIVDISMPGIDGYGVAEQVRARQLPVFLIALSAHGQPEDVSRARSAGFDAHMAKPPDLEKLEALVAAAP